MKKIAILTLVFSIFLGYALQTQAATPKAVKPIKGYVASFNDLMLGNNGKVTKDEAKKLVEAGNIMVLVSGKKVYFVYNEDGTFASKKLANYANAKLVGILGKAKTVKGFNIIVSTNIEEM